MPEKQPLPVPHALYHKDGSLWAQGQKCFDIMIGYWEWFRKDGTKMRSGSFDDAGEKFGEWTTYDKTGAVYKVTRVKPKPAPANDRPDPN